jgi:parvulin-like peptidyl-prolyl isomerase
MDKTLEQAPSQFKQHFTMPQITQATETEVLAYLKYICKLSGVAASAEQDKLVQLLCEQLNISLTNEELQAAGDDFRKRHSLLSVSAMMNWLADRRIEVEDWSRGIQIALLSRKLKEHLFGDLIDSQYLSDRNAYKRVALSQIMVSESSEALEIAQQVRSQPHLFCAYALEHSKGKQSRQNGGFLGIRFVSELLPEIAQAIATATEGEILEPVQTKLAYHIIKVEKWFPAELNESIRGQVLELLFQNWLQAQSDRNTLKNTVNTL